MKKHVIWSNDPIIVDFDELAAIYKEEFAAENPGQDDPSSLEEFYAVAEQANADMFDDECANLNIDLPRPILVFGQLGLWDGVHVGYSVIESGNVADCLRRHFNCDYLTWYIDEENDLCMDGCHHDGRNYYTFRMFKEDTDEDEAEELFEKILDGKAEYADIAELTDPIGPYIAKIYGW